jgi:hypothetical protein
VFNEDLYKKVLDDAKDEQAKRDRQRREMQQQGMKPDQIKFSNKPSRRRPQ